MGSFKLGGMTLGSIFKKPETTLYPFEKKPAPAGLKGHIAIDVSACILCSLCQKTCPAHALEVDKKTRQWIYNPFRCVQCGACVRACPKACLRMEPEYNSVSPKMESQSFAVPDPKAAKENANEAGEKQAEA